VGGLISFVCFLEGMCKFLKYFHIFPLFDAGVSPRQWQGVRVDLGEIPRVRSE
jgi:hypothetical protein